MQYAVGKTGRVIAARLFEGEDLHESILKIARTENIKCASVLIVGGFRKADVVVGPKTETPKIVPDFRHFDGPAEVLGVGTIYWNPDGPQLHMHTAIGKDKEMMIGCVRKNVKTFLVLEITITEIIDINASRKLDEKSGMNLLDIE